MISIGQRSQEDIKAMSEIIRAGRRASEQFPIYLEALASALDVPHGWLFDPKTMSFVPPPEGSVIQEEEVVEVVEEN